MIPPPQFLCGAGTSLCENLQGQNKYGIIIKQEVGGNVGWFVYMLRCRDGSLYTGCTNNLAGRLAAHQSGRGAKYTRSRLPVALAYWEELPDRSAAMRREAAVKRLTRAQKLVLLTQQTGEAPPNAGRTAGMP